MSSYRWRKCMRDCLLLSRPISLSLPPDVSFYPSYYVASTQSHFLFSLNRLLILYLSSALLLRCLVLPRCCCLMSSSTYDELDEISPAVAQFIQTTASQRRGRCEDGSSDDRVNY